MNITWPDLWFNPINLYNLPKASRMNNIMIDIETLDTKASSVVLSIGAVKFDEAGLGETFHMTLDINEQIARGRTMSGSTIQWWMQQSEAARQSVIQEGLVASEVLHGLREFMDGEKYKVWGNGAMFDNAIVLDMYSMYGIARPWSYKGDRCYRTVRAEFMEKHPNAQIDVVHGTAHNALDDAIAQAKTLQAIWALQ